MRHAGAGANPAALPRKVVAAMGLGSLGASTLFNLVSFSLVVLTAYEGAGSYVVPGIVTSSRTLKIFTVNAIVAAAARVLHVPVSVFVAAMSRSYTSIHATVVALSAVAVAFVISVAPGFAYVQIASIFAFGALLPGYLVPLHALASDISARQRDRVNATMWMSKCWGLGVVAPLLTFSIGRLLTRGYSQTEGFFYGMLITASMSGAAMAAPYFLVDAPQRRPAAPSAALSSVRACLSNPFFRPVIFTEAVSTFATGFLLTSLMFFLTPWPESDADDATYVGVIYLAIFVLLSSAMYWVVTCFTARGVEGKGLVRFGSVVTCLSLSVFTLCGADDWNTLFWVTLVWAFPYATLESVPLWLTADVSKYHHLKTGEDIAPMYSAMRLSCRAVAGAAGPFVATHILNSTVTIDEFRYRGFTACVAVVALYAATAFVIGIFDEAAMRSALEVVGDTRATRTRRNIAKDPESSIVLNEAHVALMSSRTVEALALRT